ncbi:MAG: HIT family protein [Chlamydiae bacterium]|nr:HIT family protein [Chlamydiota bacterium]
MSFILHPNFSKKHAIIDLSLSKVLLEDEVHYPWILLIPQKPGIQKIIDLPAEEQLLLYQEISLAQQILWDLFSPDQINVAAIGNKTPQLHIHIVARYRKDPAWPHTVWDHPTREHYTNYQLQVIQDLLKQAFQNAELP